MADFSYNKHFVGIKRKNKKPATLNTVKGRIINTPVSVIITAENHSPKNTEELTMVMKLVAEEKAQMRDNSLEACRMIINKSMDLSAPGEYYFVIKTYPHHILRENKAAGGTAGADRLSHGMKHSFGVTVGRAAIVNAGKEVFEISCVTEKGAQAAKKALRKVKAKIPFRNRIIFEKLE